MSIEYIGDMDFYTWLAKPNMAIFLNANRTHTKYLETVQKVAQEKGKLLTTLPKNGAAIINADDPNIIPLSTGKIYKFGFDTSSFCLITSSQLTKNFTTEIKLIANNQPLTISLPWVGEHFAYNVAAATTVSILLGIDYDTITKSLQSTPTTPRRMEVITTKSKLTIINDTHNANPLAVTQSLEALVKLAQLTKKTPVFVFGQMNELGQYEESAHQEIGHLVKKLGIKHLYTHGPATQHTVKSAAVGKYFENPDELFSQLKKFLKPSHLVLVKSSRSFKFEDQVAKLT